MTEKEKLEKEIVNVFDKFEGGMNCCLTTMIADFILARDKKRNGEAITIEALKANPAYSHIDIDSELNKARQWIARQSGRKLTPKFFVAWLNRIERPLEVSTNRSDRDREAF